MRDQTPFDESRLRRRWFLALVALVTFGVAAALLPSLGSQQQADAVEMEAIAAVFATAAQTPGESARRPGPPVSAIDCFLWVDGIPGDSVTDGHRDEIEVLSWSWGVSQSGTIGSGGGGAGKAEFDHFTVGVPQSKASPLLMRAVATGEHLEEARLACRKAGEQQTDYMVITLQDLLISSYGSSSDGSFPSEEITLNFSRVEFTYVPQKADGTFGDPVTVGWDLVLNSPV